MPQSSRTDSFALFDVEYTAKNIETGETAEFEVTTSAGYALTWADATFYTWVADSPSFSTQSFSDAYKDWEIKNREIEYHGAEWDDIRDLDTKLNSLYGVLDSDIEERPEAGIGEERTYLYIDPDVSSVRVSAEIHDTYPELETRIIGETHERGVGPIPEGTVVVGIPVPEFPVTTSHYTNQAEV